MLVSLSINDVVLIDRLTLGFDAGLAALTGETGAGKSILLDSLGLALGRRAESGLVRTGATQARVTAVFSLPADHPAHGFLEEAGLGVEPGEDLVIRRQVSADGRSRAHVNDQPATAGLLKQLAETLVEVHGQFDTQGLLEEAAHRGVLDAQAGLDRAVAATGKAWTAWRAADRALADRQAALEKARAEEEFLRHAVAELSDLSPEPGEEARLAEERRMLQNREKLLEAFTGALAQIEGEAGADRALAGAQRQLGRLADLAGPRLDPVMGALDRAQAELAEAAASLQALAVDVDADSGALERLEERLFALRAVARKHQVEVDDLAALMADFSDRLAALDDAGAGIDRLAAEADRARQAYLSEARALSHARQTAAADLDTAVAAELPPLKLDKARFMTEVTPLDEAGWGPGGIDRVRFLIATNPGSAPGPLAKIASGGELARFMLALKVVLARRMKDRAGTAPTLVFDEVDSGISGAVADAVGERLAVLGRDVQVLVVTHSPQVAARANTHFRVEKSGTDAVRTTVLQLSTEARREEIARMLSGANITDEARAAADRLLQTG